MADDRTTQKPEGWGQRWRSRYEGSVAHDLVRALGEVGFGDRIIIFGASLLLSVLPLIIVLSAFASHRIQDDIARHLGLSGQGAKIVEGLFNTSSASLSLGLLVGLVLAFAGTVAVSRSVQVIYEQAFRQSHAVGGPALVRSVVWVVAVSGVVIADGAFGKALRDDAGPAVMALVEFAGFGIFFWWSIHFLLGGRVSWRATWRGAISTALCWVGLGVVAALYFSSTIVSDSRTYGTIGVAFTLVTWFIAIGSVLTLGAVTGAVWERRTSDGGQHTPASDGSP